MASADDHQLLAYTDDLRNVRYWAPRYITLQLDESEADSRERTLAYLAMYVCNGQFRELLIERMLASEPGLFVALKQVLTAEDARLQEIARQVIDERSERPRTDSGEAHADDFDDAAGFNAMACLPPEDSRWGRDSAFVARHLFNRLEERPEDFGHLLLMFRSVQGPLFDALLDRLSDATPDQLRLMLPILRSNRELARERLAEGPLREHPADFAARDEHERRGICQANRLMTLLSLGEPGPLWAALTDSDDLTVRSYLVSRAASVRLNRAVFVERFDREEDVCVCARAILLILGGCPKNVIGPLHMTQLFDSISAWRVGPCRPGQRSRMPIRCN